MLEPGRTRDFERAMAELQQGLWIVKTEERYEPSFSYRWDLVERWLPDAVREGRRLGRAARRRAAGGPLPRRRAGPRRPGLRGCSACPRPRSTPRRPGPSAPARCARGVEIPGQPGSWLVRTA